MKYSSSKSGEFNTPTIAFIIRNGVLAYCYGPACTWHDDPCVEQVIESDQPQSLKWGVRKFLATHSNGIEDFPKSLRRIEMNAVEFEILCEEVGKKYIRRIID